MPGAPTELLARVEVFRDLDQRERKEIAGSMKEYSYEAGRTVVTEGEGGVGFFVIAVGTAKVTTAESSVRGSTAATASGWNVVRDPAIGVRSP